MKKVSVVVPVYNAEKYLGYCINSILSQTYSNIELILVNDGSTDSSISICNNYALIDDRVKVINIKNSGVSYARTMGIKCASGYYLQFVDSDDVISSNMIETLVQSMELYGKDLVLCGMNLVTLQDNIPSEIKYCTSEGIGKECVLSKKVFFENMAGFLWKTAMLEGPCNKLYKMKIVEKQKLEFPQDISLGEDFIFNLGYYENCNGVIFLEEKMYYYLQVNSQALTKKIRLDMFENQMMLIEKFEECLKRNIVISEKEKIYIAEYTIAKALHCMKLLVLNTDLDKSEIKAGIAVIINNERVRSAFAIGNYIEPEYEWMRDLYRFCDVERIYEKLRNVTSNGQNINITSQNPGILNKFLVLVLNKILKIHNIRKLEMVRNSLIDYGIKTTMYKAIFYNKKDKRNKKTI